MRTEGPKCGDNLKKKKTNWKKLVGITASMFSLLQNLVEISRLLDKYDEIQKGQHFPNGQFLVL